jgi:hypothetical protein
MHHEPMEGQTTAPARGRLTAAAAGAAVLVALAGSAAAPAFDRAGTAVFAGTLSFACAVGAVAVIGAVVALAVPGNRVGWLLLAAAAAMGAGLALTEAGVHGAVTAPGSIPGASYMAAFGPGLQADLPAKSRARSCFGPKVDNSRQLTPPALPQAKDAAGYYIQASESGGEPPGRWWGPGAKALGFEPGQMVERQPMTCCSASAGLPAAPYWAGRRAATGKPLTCTSDCWPPSRTPPPEATWRQAVRFLLTSRDQQSGRGDVIGVERHVRFATHHGLIETIPERCGLASRTSGRSKWPRCPVSWRKRQGQLGWPGWPGHRRDRGLGARVRGIRQHR